MLLLPVLPWVAITLSGDSYLEMESGDREASPKENRPPGDNC